MLQYNLLRKKKLESQEITLMEMVVFIYLIETDGYNSQKDSSVGVGE